MANFAILVGNTNYQKMTKLECCREDVAAMKELLEATGKYDLIHVVLDQDATQLKSSVRTFMDAHKGAEELFFYFSGHGVHTDADFFFCATDFDEQQPNQSGLSRTELLEFLRMADAQLVVKVIDACNSGSLLIKSESPFARQAKQGLRNLIQIASCLDSQNSLTGYPISEFTARFRSAALRKTEGVVWYMDIINTLRDEYLDSKTQIPHFVSQGTGRDQFSDDAKRFDELRAQLAVTDVDAPPQNDVVIAATPSVVEILQRGADRFASKDMAQEFIGSLFTQVTRDWPGEFGDYYMFASAEHTDYIESTSKGFIIRLMKQEKRPDSFVKVETSREKRRRNPYEAMLYPLAPVTDEDFIEHNDLILNCSVGKVQLRATFAPKFPTLKQIVLVLSCMPSLAKCYVTEVTTSHVLRNWNEYDEEGHEIVRQWRTGDWSQPPDDLAQKIREKLSSTIRTQIEASVKALMPADKT